MKTSTRYILRNKLWVPAVASYAMVLLISVVLSITNIPQAVMINGESVRDDRPSFAKFIESIKASDGVLVLGTSETVNSLSNGNYWAVLNRDPSVKAYFSVLAGAGRNCSVYFPIILKHPELFNNLKVLLYINPTYWRHGLNQFNNPYFTRYVGPQLAFSIKEIASEKNLYERFIKPAYYDGIAVDSLTFTFADHLSNGVDDFKSYFSDDLTTLLQNRKAAGMKQSTKEPGKQILQKWLNVDFNVTDSFLIQRSPFPALDVDSHFQTDALSEFIRLSKEYNIHVTFYLGPYNAIYCEHRNPELIAQYEDLLRNLRILLTNSQVPFIDGTSLSRIPGTFRDVQHISRYGAFLTAEQIKSHYEKKK